MRAADAEHVVRGLAALPRARIVIDDPEGFRCVICGQVANSPMVSGHPEGCPWRLARELTEDPRGTGIPPSEMLDRWENDLDLPGRVDTRPPQSGGAG